MIDTEAPPAGPPPRARRTRRVVLVLFLVTLLIIGGLAGYLSWAMGGGEGGRPVTVVIDEGDTANEIAAKLAEKEVVRSAFVFRLIARLRGVSTDFKPGAYRLTTGLGVSKAIDKLRTGVPEKVERFTVPEGRTVREIAELIGDQTHIAEKDFLAALLRVRTLPKPLSGHLRGKPTKPEDFEGFLFPQTYEILVRANADDVVRLMLDQFEKETTSLDFAGGAKRLGLTQYEAVVVASLVEKEARCREDLIRGKAPCRNDHALIASVIYNRLERPMRLQIDATIQYVFIQRTGKAKNPLETSDYQLDSPYNTYQIDGLPPTPIAAPGAHSLRATLQPAKSEFFFYRLCNPDALRFGHVFGRTIQERDQRWRSDPNCR